MKVKLTSVKVNLISILRKIEKLEYSEEINYELFQKVDEINNKLAEAENLVEEIVAIVDL